METFNENDLNEAIRIAEELKKLNPDRNYYRELLLSDNHDNVVAMVNEIKRLREVIYSLALEGATSNRKACE